jgi:hypothetical protein
MQKLTRLLIITGIAFLFESCNMFAPVDPLTPAASEVSVEQVWTSGATVRGKIENLDPKNDRQEKKSGKILEYGFVWGTQNQPTLEAGTVIKVGEDNPPTPFEFVREISRLDVLTTYYVRTYARNQGGGVGYGPVATFKTDDYVFAELSIGKITTTSKVSADVVVNILSLGNAEITSFGVCYSSTNEEPTTKDSRATASGESNQRELYSECNRIICGNGLLCACIRHHFGRYHLQRRHHRVRTRRTFCFHTEKIIYHVLLQSL